MAEPEHMTPWDRNARLYETLKGMGLCVTAVPFEDVPEKICWIQVSAQLPTGTLAELVDRMLPSADESPVPVNVRSPLQGTEVVEGVVPTLTERANVIDFPPVL